MATSDSDDFESADEELVAPAMSSKSRNNRQWQSPTSTIDSDSDDDNECMPAAVNSAAWNSTIHTVQTSGQERRARPSEAKDNSTAILSGETKDSAAAETKATVAEKTSEEEKNKADETRDSHETGTQKSDKKDENAEMKHNEPCAKDSGADAASNKKEKRQKKLKETTSLGAKKLGSRVSENSCPKPPPIDATTPDEIRKKALAEGQEAPVIEECWELDEEETAKIFKGLSSVDRVRMPEELRSEKKFKDVFKTDGWEGLDDEAILTELEEDRIHPVLERIATEESSDAGWASWGSWGVSSLINSATAGVSTLTSHVTHGLTLLDEAMGAPNPDDLANNDFGDDKNAIDADKSCINQEIESQGSFGFNHLLSGVSSITKLVETTGSKVITGGLGTLETIGKKTMEVLQEGDPGLKKKRAFFLNDSDKPILSQMLREAKEKAEVEEKTLEEKQLLRKVHLESLFDDFQGLVHLEALEMLSKQCNIKIQQRLVTLDEEELASIQETLEEVKELCDLGDEEENDEDDNDNDLQDRLKAACKDLGVSITYEKIDDIWKDTRMYFTEISSEESRVTERKVFQRAISTLARFTAFSVERFHKTAELLLIKERRSTVNEADALVQLTRILSGQIAIAANLFSKWLNDHIEKGQQSDSKVDISTIFLEAANASSYIQDAFRLLVPILQVGAI